MGVDVGRGADVGMAGEHLRNLVGRQPARLALCTAVNQRDLLSIHAGESKPAPPRTWTHSAC